MELTSVIAKDQGEEEPIARPEGQITGEQALNRHPLKAPLHIGGGWLATEARNGKDKTEPILAMLAEARPTDRTTQVELKGLKLGLFTQLSTHTSYNILISFELATHAIILAEVQITGARIAMDKENATPVG